jgi:hypothetical protein
MERKTWHGQVLRPIAGERDSERKFQRQLNEPRRQSSQDLVKCGRTNVTIGQSEVGMVQEVEELGPELKLLPFCNRNALEGGEIPLGIARPFGDVPSSRTELLHRRQRIGGNLLERIRVEPSAGGSWTAVGILTRNQIWTIGRKTGDFWRPALLGNIH